MTDLKGFMLILNPYIFTLNKANMSFGGYNKVATIVVFLYSVLEITKLYNNCVMIRLNCVIILNYYSLLSEC
jgi:hypothetical protein